MAFCSLPSPLDTCGLSPFEGNVKASVSMSKYVKDVSEWGHLTPLDLVVVIAVFSAAVPTHLCCASQVSMAYVTICEVNDASGHQSVGSVGISGKCTWRVWKWSSPVVESMEISLQVLASVLLFTICNLICLQLFYCLITLFYSAIRPFVFSCSYSEPHNEVTFPWLTHSPRCLLTISWHFLSPHTFITPSVLLTLGWWPGKDILILSPSNLPVHWISTVASLFLPVALSQPRLHSPLMYLIHPPSICSGTCFCHCPSSSISLLSSLLNHLPF